MVILFRFLVASLAFFACHCHGYNGFWNLRGEELDKYFLETLQRISPAPEFALSNDYPSTPELLRRAGYTSEEYNVTTEDGYILTIFRVTGYKVTKKKPILLLPGSGAGSDMMVASGQESIGLVLVSAGFDVWLGNVRGTIYGKGHIKLSSKMKKFWAFSFHEMAYYDIPAMFEQMILTTGSKKVSFLGHSGGCTLFLVMAAARPEYDAKMSAAILLGPVAGRMRDLRNPMIFNIAQRFSFDFIKKNKIYQLFPHNYLARRLIVQPCYTNFFRWFCLASLTRSASGDISHWNLDRAINITSFGSTGTSVKAIEHYKQLVTTDRLAQYDYGPEENLKRYGSTIPPIYDVTKIKAFVALFIGKNDGSSDIFIGQNLASKLQNVKLFVLEDKKFNHLDFFVAEDLRKAYLHLVIEVLDSRDNV